MKSACVIVSTGFEEIEAITIIDVLRRAGVEVTVAGLGGTSIEGAHGVRLTTDAQVATVRQRTFDCLILPGGMPNAATLAADDAVQAMVRQQHQRGGKLAAICAAPMALGAAGVLEGKRATCYPGFESSLRGASVSSEPVVQDGAVTTSRGPATAMDFALALAADLAGAEAAATVRRQLLA